MSRIVSRRGEVQHWLKGALILEYDRGSRVARSKFKDTGGFGQHDAGHISCRTTEAPCASGT